MTGKYAKDSHNENKRKIHSALVMEVEVGAMYQSHGGQTIATAQYAGKVGDDSFEYV